jgi:hypothetical protein
VSATCSSPFGIMQKAVTYLRRSRSRFG